MRDASLVLTDTYHLAVNAWRLGTPAVLLAPGGGIAADVNGGSATSYRDKRRDLYSQWEALPLLLDLRAARFRQGAEARRLAEHLATPDLLDVTWGRVRALEQQALDTLRVAVGDGPLARVKG